MLRKKLIIIVDGYLNLCKFKHVHIDIQITGLIQGYNISKAILTTMRNSRPLEI